jgi:hypothetical protein
VITAAYGAGWNMVGAPPGTDLSAASYLYAYDGTNYVTPSSSRAALCTGYWAYFTDPHPTPLNPTANGPMETCPLHKGWNLVGNPFSGAATLPANVTAWYWNADAGRYDMVSSIPVGGAVWIYSTQTTAVPLQFVEVVTRTPATLLITNFASNGPFHILVGDYVKLLLPSITPVNASADAGRLHLESAGTANELDCLSGSCTFTGPSEQFWIWRAIAPGTATINVTSRCTDSSCISVTQSLDIQIGI